MSEHKQIETVIRNSMVAIASGDCTFSQVKFSLGSIPWKITVEIDEEKLLEQQND